MFRLFFGRQIADETLDIFDFGQVPHFSLSIQSAINQVP